MLDEKVDNKKVLSDEARKEIIRDPVVPFSAWSQILFRFCVLWGNALFPVRVIDKNVKGKETNAQTNELFRMC
jgi:hypothetical protein